MLQIVFRKFMGLIHFRDWLIFIISEFDNNFFHIFDPGVMLEVIIEHFKNNFAEGEEILIGFKILVLLCDGGI